MEKTVSEAKEMKLGIRKLNAAGKSIKTIGKAILFFIIVSILMVAGIVFYIFNVGKVSPMSFFMLGLLEIFMSIGIIYELFSAGNILESITKDDFL